MIAFKSLINGVLDRRYVKTQVSHSSNGTYDFEDRDVIGKVKLLKLKGNGEFVGSPITFQQFFNPSLISYYRITQTGDIDPYVYTVNNTGDAYFNLTSLNLSSSKKYLCIADFSNVSSNNTWGFPSESNSYLKTVINGRNWWISNGGSYLDNGVTNTPYPSITNIQIFCLTDMLNDGILTSIPTTYDDFIVQTGLRNVFYPYGENSVMSYQIKAFKPTSITIGDTIIDLSSIMEHFPNGLLGNNNIYDEIDFVNQKAIKKINSQTGEPLSVMSIETYDFNIGINEYDFGDITIQNDSDINSNLNFEFYSLQV